MKSMFLVKAFVVTLLIAAGICFLVSCDRFSKGTLSGNIKTIYIVSIDKPDILTTVLSEKEVTLLRYDDTLIQKDKELRGECSEKINAAYERFWGERPQFSSVIGQSRLYHIQGANSIIQNCTNNRNNIILPYTIQKVTTDANGGCFPL